MVLLQEKPVERRSSIVRLAGRSLALFLGLAVAATVGATTSRAASSAPQDGKPVRPSVEETTFKSVDAVVAGQWDFPKRTPAPLVVLLPASGGVDRHGLPPGYGDEPQLGIYAQLTEKLVEAGFAVFRYDSPGAGRSSRGRYATDRSTALEAYGRAVDHARIDPSKVFLFGHSKGTDTISGIYPRYEERNPLAGVILLSNTIGEAEILRIVAPILVLVTEKNPEDLYQRGRFVADARSRVTDKKLETKLVTVPGAEHSLLTTTEISKGKRYSIHPKALGAIIEWLRKLHGQAVAS